LYILITYDVQVTSPTGSKRLRKIAQACKNYGQRVQNSVFECDVNEVQFTQLVHQIEQILNPKEDTIRIYPLSNKARKNIVHLGIKEPIDFRDPLIF
jgi:CRISPR-associated protein Cas2